MTGRANKPVLKKDSGKPVSHEEVYQMVMLHSYQRIPIDRIARRFSIDPIEARVLIGRRTGGSCCG